MKPVLTRLRLDHALQTTPVQYDSTMDTEA